MSEQSTSFAKQSAAYNSSGGERTATYCNKGGIHTGELIQLVCTEAACRRDSLCCVICKSQQHKRHKTVLLKTFVEDVHWRAHTTQQLRSSHVQEDLFESEQKCLSSLQSLQRYVVLKLQKFEQRVVEYYRFLREKQQGSASTVVTAPTKTGSQPLFYRSSLSTLQRLQTASDLETLRQSVNEVLECAKIEEGRVKELSKSFLAQQRGNTQQKIAQSDVVPAEQDYETFQKRLLQCLRSVHTSFSDEYKRIQGALPPYLRSKLSSMSQSNFFSRDETLGASQVAGGLRALVPSPDSKSENAVQNGISNFSDVSQKVSVLIESNVVSLKENNVEDNRKFSGVATTPFDSISIAGTVSRVESTPLAQASSSARWNGATSSLQSAVVSANSSQRAYTTTSSLERKFAFRFSTTQHHLYVEVQRNGVLGKSSPSSGETKLLLAEPSVESKPLREVTWAFRIIACKNLAYSTPLAIGLCHGKLAANNNFAFRGEDASASRCNSIEYGSTQNTFTTTAAPSSVEHGCYLISANGIVRNHADPSEDMRRSRVRFSQGDLILCTYNPFKQHLRISKRSGAQSKESDPLYIRVPAHTSRDVLYPCVRFSYAGDAVEIINL